MPGHDNELVRAAAFVSQESGIQCATVTAAQFASAQRRLDTKVDRCVAELAAAALTPKVRQQHDYRPPFITKVSAVK